MTVIPIKKEGKNGSMVRSVWDAEVQMVASVGRHGRGRGRGRTAAVVANGNGAGRRGGGGAASTLSADSDIRFTRHKLSRGCKGGCVCLAAFLVVLLLAAVAVYLGHTYLSGEPISPQVFLGVFKVTNDPWHMDYADPSTKVYKLKSRDYRERLNLIYKRSLLRSGFMGTEILALDSSTGNDLMVHFDLRFDPTYLTVNVIDVENVMLEEIRLQNYSRYLVNVLIDIDSLQIEETHTAFETSMTVSSASNVVTTTISTTIPPPPRKCEPIKLTMCSSLEYNLTSYPNIMGHKSLSEVEEDMIAFRELMDAECYRSAEDFVCQLLQPACTLGDDEDRLVMPCRSYCRDFYAGCGNRLPERLKKYINCSRFPDFYGIGSCKPKTNCAASLQAKSMGIRICDGVPDCEDFSDEKTCNYCTANQLHCGTEKACIPYYKRCDGVNDCIGGSDEKSCVTISPNVTQLVQRTAETPFSYQHDYEGFVIHNTQGTLSKLCHTSNDTSGDTMNNVAKNICHSLTFGTSKFVYIRTDQEFSNNYVEIENPNATVIKFRKTKCPSKKVLYVGCSDFNCGQQSARDQTGIEKLKKISQNGDWPWHAVLLREDVHVCDATMVAADWLITTASCFQGQPKAEWIARLGSVRISSSSPWQQERRIIGMVKSPVEGSTVVLIKMDESVHMSDFVRPICLPSTASTVDMPYCNTLGWTRNRDELMRIHVNVTPMEKCENVSIATENSMCTEATYEQNDCTEEEFAGSPLVCFDLDRKLWSLVGLSNWRIACSQLGVERPRMYDKITSNVEWIRKTIAAQV